MSNDRKMENKNTSLPGLECDQKKKKFIHKKEY